MIKYLYLGEVSFFAFPHDKLGYSKVRVALFDPDHHEDEGLPVAAVEKAGLDDVVETHLALTAEADSVFSVFLRILTMCREI